MNRRDEVWRGVGSFTLPAALAIGGSMATLALTTGRSSPVAAGPLPETTVTAVTTRTAAAAPPSPERRPSSPPARRPAPRPVPQRVVAADTDTGTGTEPRQPAERPVAARSGPSPHPSNPAPGGPSSTPPGAGCAPAGLTLCLQLGHITIKAGEGGDR